MLSIKNLTASINGTPVLSRGHQAALAQARRKCWMKRINHEDRKTTKRAIMPSCLFSWSQWSSWLISWFWS